MSVVPIGDAGFRLVCNRDERLTRPPALPPRIHRAGRRMAISPIDLLGGGSWIGVNDAGLAVALLNRSHGSGAGLQAGQTRGVFVPLCLPHDNIASALAAAGEIDVSRLPPFTLVLVHRRHVAAATSDGRVLTVSRSPFASPLLFTSSSLGDGRVDGPRRRLFEKLTGSGPHSWLAGQRVFHQHQWPDHPEISVRMARQDAATVSRSIVEVAPPRVRFRYEPVTTGVRAA